MMRRDRKLFIIFASFVLFGTARCTVWDPAVGVRCDEFPAYCARAGGSAPGDASSDRAIEVPADAGEVNAADTGPPISFARDIRPLMNRSETDPAGPGCSHCHYRTTGTQQGIIEGQMDMTTLGDLRRGGKTSHASVVVPGDPEGSAIVQKLRGTYPVGARMPWSGPPYWTDAEIDLMARWIAQGARGADDE